MPDRGLFAITEDTGTGVRPAVKAGTLGVREHARECLYELCGAMACVRESGKGRGMLLAQFR